MVVAVAVVAVTATTGFRDGPPARVTGGFGEDDCTACHYADMGPPASGRATLAGLPERFTPGKTYRLELMLEHAGMVVGGFQLAIRQAGGDTASESPAQAGSLAVPEEHDHRVDVMTERGIQFAQQRPDGSAAEPGVDGESEHAGAERVNWSVLWTAPESGSAVVLHAALVAGDGDQSQIGDAVYTLHRELHPAEINLRSHR